MTWKHAVIVTSFMLNVFVLALPGGLKIWALLRDLYGATGQEELADLFVVGSQALGLFVAGMCNVASVLVAIALRGRAQRVAITLAVVSLIALALTIALLIHTYGDLAKIILWAAAAMFTTMSLWLWRPALRSDLRCPKCFGALTSIAVAVCPACGAQVSDEAAQWLNRNRPDLPPVSAEANVTGWKVAFIFVSFVLNIIVFVLPGIVLVLNAFSSGRIETGVVGLGSLVIGVLNISCAIKTHESDKRGRVLAIKVGCITNGAAVPFVFHVSSFTVFPELLAIYLFTIAISLAVYAIPRPRERPQGLCVHCEYDLTGLPSSICPECGNKATR